MSPSWVRLTAAVWLRPVAVVRNKQTPSADLVGQRCAVNSNSEDRYHINNQTAKGDFGNYAAVLFNGLKLPPPLN